MTSYIEIQELKKSIAEKAKKRKLLGNPPTSRDKTSIGDEVIWESHISKCDIVIVSRDKTYTRNNDLLKTEFTNKTGNQLLHITDKITSANLDR